MQIRTGRFSILLLVPFFVDVCAVPPRGVIVLCAGDSITAQAYPHFLQKLLNRDGIPARVLNYGRSGNTSGEYLGFLRGRGDVLGNSHPDFILVQLGTNDVRNDKDFTSGKNFAENMRAIVSIFRTFKTRAGNAPRILMATIPPLPTASSFPFSAESCRRVIDEINPAIRALARELDIPAVDNYQVFVGRPDLLPDVHPSREGYRSLAGNWYEAMAPFLKEVRRRR
jgi:lysophospholipase L1-like esterase